MIKKLLIKDIIDEDFINYKLPSMFIATSRCSFKCEKEDCNVKCQNSKIANQPDIEIMIEHIIDRYLNNSITKAVVFGGLEPLDRISEILDFIIQFRKVSSDDIVIYTGYTELEVKAFKCNKKPFLNSLLNANKSSNNGGNLIIKYGRFKSNNDKTYDDILGIELASSNQYAKLYNWKDVVWMEKYISRFNISSNVTKGKSKQIVICPKCKYKNIVNNINKLTYSKINTISCVRCRNLIKIGDIFNFKTGTKLNKINKNHNQQTLDDYIWNNNYDQI